MVSARRGWSYETCERCEMPPRYPALSTAIQHFLKEHWRQPDRRFAEALHAVIGSTSGS